jgi:hypothetical protein
LPIEPGALYVLTAKSTPDAVVHEALGLAREFTWTDETARKMMRVAERFKSRNFRDLSLPIEPGARAPWWQATLACAPPPVPGWPEIRP